MADYDPIALLVCLGQLTFENRVLLEQNATLARELEALRTVGPPEPSPPARSGSRRSGSKEG